MRRLRLLAALAAFLAVVAVPAASALDIIEDIQPPTGAVGEPYSFQIQAEEGCENSYQFRLIGSAPMPPGLTLQLNGLITGTPTEAGTWDFFVELRDVCEPAFPNSKPSQGKFRITIKPRVTITTTSLAPTLVGKPYTVKIGSSGAETQWWSIDAGTLPPGLALTADGTLTGTPTTVGSYTFTIKLVSPGPVRSATQQLTLVVASPVAASAPAAKPAEVGRPVKIAPATTGGAAPFSWTVARGSLPAGLVLDPATGAISGTPTAAGTSTFTLSVSEAAGTSASVEMTLTVAPKLQIATTKLALAQRGATYRERLVSRGGVAPVRWRFVRGSMPRGIRLDTRTGTLTGVPRRRGRYQLTLRASDSLGVLATRTLVLVVR